MCGGGSNDVEPTQHEIALWNVAADEWNMYQREIVPIENEFMKRVDSMDSKGSYDFAKGVANVDAQNANSEYAEKVSANETAKGINPNSGRFKMGMADVAEKSGRNAGDNMGRATVEQQDRYIGGLGNIVAMGQNQATTAQAGLGDLAQASTVNARMDAENDFNSDMANQNLVGTGAGLAASYYMNKEK
jgi:hypothetical protein